MEVLQDKLIGFIDWVATHERHSGRERRRTAIDWVDNVTDLATVKRFTLRFSLRWPIHIIDPVDKTKGETAWGRGCIKMTINLCIYV